MTDTAHADLPPGRVGGVDYGTVRIGVAVTDRRRTLASPHQVYTRRNERLDAEYFKQLAVNERLILWVVGLPVHCSGDEGGKAYEARQFGAWLQQITGLPVEFFDERFTSAMADELLRQGEFTKARRRERRDMLAAQIMLSAWMESRHRNLPPAPLEDR